MITMYDSIDLSVIPEDADAVAGYVGGHWPTFQRLAIHFPLAHKLSIAVTAQQDADCLDIEAGDAQPEQAPAWVRRQHARGAHRPCLYANASTMPAVVAALRRAGIPRSSVRLWVASWTGHPHLEPGSDATQWHNRALGRNLDVSLCRADFFGTPTDPRLPKWRAELHARRAWLHEATQTRKRIPAVRQRIHALEKAIRKHRR